VSGAFPARFPGQCKHPECGRWFARDEEVAFHRVEPGDSKAVLMHVDCARGLVGLKADDIELRKNETVCPDCYLAHKGECL